MARDTTNDDLLLHALADGELDAATALALEQRIATEPDVAAAYDEILAVKSAIGRLERPAVTEDFHAKIAALAAPTASKVVPIRRPTPRPFAPDWRMMAASLVLTAGLASGVTYTMTAQRGDAAIEDAILGGHRRSLVAASPIDIASSDRHTVRPWFDAKLGLSPPTPDLGAQGFPLVGGRIEIVGGKAVPALVYRHAEHLITLVALPDEGSPMPPTSSGADGYNIVRWRAGGFSYWALSDLDKAELDGFVQDLRETKPAPR